jgi:hypothetical protein
MLLARLFFFFIKGIILRGDFLDIELWVPAGWQGIQCVTIPQACTATGAMSIVRGCPGKAEFAHVS